MGNIGKLSKIQGLGQAVGACNALIDAVTRLTPVESPTVKPSFTGSGISYAAKPPKPSGIIKSYPTDFTIKSMAENKVTIYGGDIQIGDSEPINVGDTQLIITTETAIVGYEYTFSNQSFGIVNFGSTFVTDSAYIRKKLFTFSYTNSILTLTRIHDMQMYPANFGN